MADFLNYDFEIEYPKEIDLVPELVDKGFHIRKLLPRWQRVWDKHSGVFEKGVTYSLEEIELTLRKRGIKKVEIEMAMRQFWRRGYVERFRERKRYGNLGKVHYKFKGS